MNENNKSIKRTYYLKYWKHAFLSMKHEEKAAINNLANPWDYNRNSATVVIAVASKNFFLPEAYLKSHNIVALYIHIHPMGKLGPIFPHFDNSISTYIVPTTITIKGVYRGGGRGYCHPLKMHPY